MNSDRINVVVVDGDGRIVTMKTAWFPEVTLHGFPRNKAKDYRLKSVKELLILAGRNGVDYDVFVNLFIIKQHSRVTPPTRNRKTTRFARRQLLQHELLMANEAPILLK